jgi:hypothetical protein
VWVETRTPAVTFGGASNFALSFGDNVGPGPSANVSLGKHRGHRVRRRRTCSSADRSHSPNPRRQLHYTIADDDYTVLCNNAAVWRRSHHAAAAAASNRGRVYIVKRVNPNVAELTTTAGGEPSME